MAEGIFSRDVIMVGCSEMLWQNLLSSWQTKTASWKIYYVQSSYSARRLREKQRPSTWLRCPCMTRGTHGWLSLSSRCHLRSIDRSIAISLGRSFSRRSQHKMGGFLQVGCRQCLRERAGVSSWPGSLRCMVGPMCPQGRGLQLVFDFQATRLRT